ncbi:tetratricopeptide repeat protein [Kitasatospora sp. NPDC006697]|uniref:tetratricopeptide repeat protein n=1 Tax=Kitasatospora sp. NPDC006697 TaxID=3364020 RepID=UPI0036C704DF
MTQDRVVLIDGPNGPGSGYAIGPQLILTAAHVVGTEGTVRLFRPGSGALPATVVWRGTGRLDAALLHVTDERWQWAGTAGTRWGEFVTVLADQRCDAQGAPALAQFDGEGNRKTYTEQRQVPGTVDPGSGFVGDRYLFTLDGSVDAWPRKELPWGGLSGAALFHGSLLVGVLVAETRTPGHAELQAVPAYLLLRDASFHAALARYGADSARLEPAEFDRLVSHESLGPVRADGSPTALLRPEREAVGFHGRDELLAELLDWCREDGVAALLVHGPGGQGKTRLVRELAHRLTAAADHGRWTTVWLRPADPVEPQDLGVLQETTRRMLVVLDYAESRIDQLAELLAATRERTTPFKVVLIARTDGDWWAQARSANGLARDVLWAARREALPPLAEHPGDRPALYRTAARAFADRLPPQDGRPPWPVLAAALPERDLGDPGFANPLTLHMTALADLLDAAEPAAGPHGGNPDDVESRLLDHENGYWHRLMVARGVTARQAPEAELFKDAMAAAILLGADGPSELDEALRRVRGLADEWRRGPVGDWLAAAYPPAADGPSHWGGLQPDRLAERFAGQRVLDRRHLLPALVDGADGAPAVRLLTVLTRAAGHRPLRERLGPRVTRLCAEHPDRLALPAIAVVPQVERPEPLLEALEVLLDAPGNGADRLDEWLGALPNSSYHLGPWAVRLLERLVDHRREQGTEGGQELLALVTALRELCRRYTDTGEWESALTPVEEAIALLRPALAGGGQATPHRVALRNKLAGCLNNQALILAELGRPAEARGPAEEAVALHRELAALDGLEKPRYLSSALGTLALVCGELGDLTEALPLREEVVSRLEGLVADSGDPQAAVDLARGLNNLALLYRRIGRNARGLERSRQALALLRPLARKQPDALDPLLVVVLGTHAACLGTAGRDEEGLRAIEESVAIRRRLAAGRPAAYRDGLAKALNSLAIDLSRVGRSTEALAVVSEAVEIYEELAERQPGAYREPLAMTLNSHSNELRDIGRFEEAVRAAERAVAIYARLHLDLDHAYAADHAMALGTLGLGLEKVGRPEEALFRIEQAVRIHRALPGRLAGAARPDLARCLNNIAGAHRHAGRPAEGLPACEEGVRICRELAAEDPEAFTPLLARLLTTRAYCLNETGRREEAAEVAVEAVTAVTPTVAQPESADMLSGLSALLSLAGRPEEALAALRPVVEALRALARTDPDRHQRDLLVTLDGFRYQLAGTGRLAESLEVAAEVLAIHRARWEAGRTPELRAALARTLAGHGDVLQQLGRGSEAAAHIAEAVELWRGMPRPEYDAHLPGPALALSSHASVLWLAGARGEALATLDQAAEAFARMPETAPVRHAGVAMSLTTRGGLLDDLGDPSAVEVMDRAVESARAIKGSGLEAFEGIVANALALRARIRADREPPLPGATADAAEAVAVHRQLHLANPGRGPAPVAGAMSVLGLCQARDGRAEEAAETTAQAVALIREAQDPSGLLLADALFLFAEVRRITGTDLEPARAAVREAADLLRRVAEERPALVEFGLARCERLREALQAR